MAKSEDKIKTQAVGAYGEKVAEAELLRRLWVPANVNASIKNAADFDIFALKDGHTVHIRVKTCGPDTKIFQYGFKKEQDIPINGLHKTDFTILVSMGQTRADDEFYIVPTRIVREALAGHRRLWLDNLRKDGKPHVDSGHWSLRLKGEIADPDPGRGLEKKWAKYRDCKYLKNDTKRPV